MLGRTALVAAIAAAAALPQPAHAFSPRLLVTAGESAGITAVELGDPDGAAASVSVYAPPGYTARLDALPGEQLGRVPSATVSIAGLLVTLEGELRATASSAPAGSCTPGPHDATMALALRAPGLDVSLPVELDRASVAEAGYASYRLTVCTTDAGQTRLVALRLLLDGLLAPPPNPARHVWRGVFTPFSAEGVPAPAAAVEARSILPWPARLELRASYDPFKGAAGLRGSLSAGGEPVAGRQLRLFAGPGARPTRRSGSVTTGPAGRFRALRGIAGQTTFRATAFVPAEDVSATACGDPIAPGGCVAAVVAPLTAESPAVRVRVPQPLRLGSGGGLVRTLQRTLVRLRYLPATARSGSFDDSTWHAVVAFQGWQGLPRDGVVAARVWRALGQARPPRPWGGMRAGLQIDTARQVLFLVERGRVVRAIHVSTGAGGGTPLGRFTVYRKELLSWSVPFEVWMPYASYFYGGYALHSYPSVPSYAASHGCVRVPAADAPSVYAFAGFGAAVWVR